MAPGSSCMRFPLISSELPKYPGGKQTRCKGEGIHMLSRAPIVPVVVPSWRLWLVHTVNAQNVMQDGMCRPVWVVDSQASG